MKALIVCSVHALCDISRLERDACNRACARHGIPAILTAQSHARIIENTTMIDVLNDLPSSREQREGLIASYLDMLNDEIWSTSLRAHQSVLATLRDPKIFVRPTGFVSDYPTLTTNLVRSAALLTNATRLGHLTTLTDPLNKQSVAERLEAAASALNVAHRAVDVLVARQRDFVAAQSLGMHPRFLEELHPRTSTIKQRYMARTATTTEPSINTTPVSQPVAVPA